MLNEKYLPSKAPDFRGLNRSVSQMELFSPTSSIRSGSLLAGSIQVSKKLKGLGWTARCPPRPSTSLQGAPIQRRLSQSRYQENRYRYKSAQLSFNVWKCTSFISSSASEAFVWPPPLHLWKMSAFFAWCPPQVYVIYDFAVYTKYCVHSFNCA